MTLALTLDLKRRVEAAFRAWLEALPPSAAAEPVAARAEAVRGVLDLVFAAFSAARGGASTPPQVARPAQRAQIALDAGPWGPDPLPWAEVEAWQLGHAYEVLLGLDVTRAGSTLRAEAGTTRRSLGAHYSPRWLTRPLTEAALAPLLAEASPAQILSLRVLDPSMGAGAFLLEAAEALSGALVEAWARAPAHPGIDGGELPPEGAPRIGLARRLVARTCIAGVDRDPVAVEVARFALGAFAGEAEGVGRRLHVGDALIGLDVAQLRTMSLDRRGDAPPWLFAPPVDGLVARALEAQREDRGAETDALAILQIVGDLLVAAHFDASSPARRRRQAEEARAQIQALLDGLARGRDVDLAGVQVEAAERLGGHRPLHWPVAFPELFLDAAGPAGFSVVLGNPPFGNAIEETTARDEPARSFYREAYPEAARGAFDLSNLFLVASVRHLRPGGRFALLQPRANLSQGSARDTQRWVDQHAPLDLLFAPDDAALFPGASVYVACPVGTRLSGPRRPLPRRVRVVVGLDITAGREVVQAPEEPWWSLVTATDRPGMSLRPDLVPLSTWVDLHAGCATAVAYLLKDQVDDDRAGAGLKLVTTGLIDRHGCGWGARPARFLGGTYEYPRWPAHPPAGPLQRALDRQRAPKVLVGGLSRRIEAFADLEGTCAGVVSTHVATPRYTGLDLRVLAAVLSSWAFSYNYMRRFGAKRMGRGNWTYGRRELLETMVPAELVARDFQTRILALLDPAGRPRGEEGALQAEIARAFGARPEEIAGLLQWYGAAG